MQKILWKQKSLYQRWRAIDDDYGIVEGCTIVDIQALRSHSCNNLAPDVWTVPPVSLSPISAANTIGRPSV